MSDAVAVVGGRTATDLLDVTSDPSALDGEGFWAVAVTYEGAITCARFAAVQPGRPTAATWHGPARDAWASSLSETEYMDRVEIIRDNIAAGEVYQANLCRVLSARVNDAPDMLALGAALAVGNPAPYAAVIDLPDHGLRIASASPERFLRRDRRIVSCDPIKGTAVTGDGLLPKDHAENVMIVDLVRNDLSRVAEVGSVTVPRLCEVERHPGLVHLVSRVEARLRPGAGWAELLAATCPPGSVTGAPKSSAVRLISELEPVRRSVYCGAVGWVDADAQQALLAVAIRTFWAEDGQLHFGTGAGITWSSDAAAEWAETELKASRLLTVASA